MGEVVGLATAPVAAPVMVLAAIVLWLRPSRPLRPMPASSPSSSAATPSRRLEPWWYGLVGFGLLGWFTRSPVMAMVGVVVAVLGRHVARRRAERNLDVEIDAAMVGLVADLGQRLRSGAALVPAFNALVRADPTAALVFGPVVDEASLRGGLAARLAGISVTTSRDSVRLVAISLSVLGRRGGPAVAALDRLGQSLRDRQANEAERRAQASQARASAVVLGLLPLVFASVSAAVDADLRQFYLRSATGAICVLLMLGMVVACFAWIDAVTRSQA